MNLFCKNQYFIHTGEARLVYQEKPKAPESVVNLGTEIVMSGEKEKPKPKMPKEVANFLERIKESVERTESAAKKGAVSAEESKTEKPKNKKPG